MRHRALQLFAVCCLVALAGCSGALSGVDGAGDPTLEDVSYPAGVSENGTNVSALADAHSTALENESFTFEFESATNSSVVNQTYRIDAAVGPDRETVRANASVRNQTTAVYLTDGRHFARIGTGANATYQSGERTPRVASLFALSSSGGRLVEQFAGSANFTPTDAREVNGTTLLVLRADGSNVTAAEQANVTEYNATVLVTERGVVHSITVEQTAVQDGREFRTNASLRFTAIGATTVAEPSWLDEVRNQTAD